MERPYTGDKWFIKELGDYYCLVCDSKVFESNHKFFSKSGLPAFWGSCPESTTVNEEDGVVCCAECKSSLGQYYDKGPLPTRQHYSINSAALVFRSKEWFTLPPPRKEIRRQKRAKAEALAS